MSQQILKNVYLFGNIYTLFGVETDTQLISKMGIITVCSSLITLVLGWIIPAPYGRYLKTTGPTMNAKLSWMIQECPSFLIPFYLLCKSPSFQMPNLPNKISVAIFMAHYFQRSFVYPCRVSRQARPVPIWSVASAFFFCAWNGFYQGHHLINVSEVSDSPFILPGVALFMLGMFINIFHDGILIYLSERSSPIIDDGTNNYRQHTYQIPTGGLFDYISGANYFGEILEWWGFALITRQFPQIIFAIFSTQFLAQRARHHHQFYKTVFGENYPAERKAIIPFIL